MNEWIPHHLLSFFSDLLDSLLTSVSVFYLFLPIYSPLIPSGGFIQNTDGLGFKISFSSLLPTGFRLWPSTPPLPASHHFSWTVLQLGRPHHAPSWPAFWNAPSSPRELLLLFLEILLKEYPFFHWSNYFASPLTITGFLFSPLLESMYSFYCYATKSSVLSLPQQTPECLRARPKFY